LQSVCRSGPAWRVHNAGDLLTCVFLEPEAGIEPATPRLRIVCSAKLSYSGEPADCSARTSRRNGGKASYCLLRHEGKGNRLRTFRTVVVALMGATLLGSWAVPAPAGVLCFGQIPTEPFTPGPDVITGTAGPDVLYGGLGADQIDGRGGNDRICGAEDRDFLEGASGSDLMSGGTDLDDMFGGLGPDRMFAGPGIPQEPGGDPDQTNILYGQGGSDRLIGGTHPDSLSGGEGGDFLDGNGGFDGCNGGPGADTIRDCET
jgi:hypothetical protein